MVELALEMSGVDKEIASLQPERDPFAWMGKGGSKATRVLGDFVQDIARIKAREDWDKSRKKGEIALAGWKLADNLPPGLKEAEVVNALGSSSTAIRQWRERGLFSPTFMKKGVPTGRGILRYDTWQYSSEDLLRALLVVAHRKLEPKRSLAEMAEIFETERDWDTNPAYLERAYEYLISQELFRFHFLRESDPKLLPGKL